VRVWILDANERARRFYERCGFVADGTADRFTAHRPDGTVVDLNEIRYVYITEDEAQRSSLRSTHNDMADPTSG
jgi:RimJ/RimL family protein N-acetyltransferase